jgi:glucosamine--fructose-6-phosphate aminotransferase (isomerizing)
MPRSAAELHRPRRARAPELEPRPAAAGLWANLGAVRAGMYPSVAGSSASTWPTPTSASFPQTAEFNTTWTRPSRRQWSPTSALVTNAASNRIARSATALQAQLAQLREGTEIEVRSGTWIAAQTANAAHRVRAAPARRRGGELPRPTRALPRRERRCPATSPTPSSTCSARASRWSTPTSTCARPSPACAAPWASASPTEPPLSPPERPHGPDQSRTPTGRAPRFDHSPLRPQRARLCPPAALDILRRGVQPETRRRSTHVRHHRLRRHEECAPILLEGLRRLEYRGYDSAGVAVHDGRDLNVRRAAGKLTALGDVLARDPVHGTTGIGHTRWATHGKPAERNAHPHVSGDIAVVHNGIIENHVELKAELCGRRAGSFTRTPTRRSSRTWSTSPRSAASTSSRRCARPSSVIRGAYAIAVLSRADPTRIVLAKNASPLVLGVGDGVMLAASDVPALLAHTRDVIFLEDGEMAEITREGARIETVAGVASSAPHAHHLVADAGRARRVQALHAQGDPRAAPRPRGHAARPGAPGGRAARAREMGINVEDARAVKRVVFLACGTSYHAALHGRYLLEALGAGARGGRARERVPLPRPGGGRRRPRGGRVPVRRDRRHAGRRQGGQGARRSHPRGGQRAGQRHRPRRARHALHPRGPGDRRGQHQVLHRAARGAHDARVHLGRSRGALSAEKAHALLSEFVQVPHKMRTALEGAKHVESVARSILHTRDALFSGGGSRAPSRWRARSSSRRSRTCTPRATRAAR